MKKLGLVAILGAFLALPAVVEAQGDADATANITATVMESLSLEVTQHLLFGDVFQGEPATVEWDGADAARFVAAGQADTNILVTVPAVTELEEVGGAATIPFTQDFFGADEDDVESASLEDLSTADDYTVALHETTGNFYFWLGGTLSPGAEQTAGAYEATFMVEIEYTD